MRLPLNLGYGIGRLPSADKGLGPKKGGMQPKAQPNIPQDIDSAKNALDNLINRNPLGEELDNLANRNNWTWG